ncbi:Transmembrane protein 65 [Fukomys damarensis]|uniref:Transmembrane protein 65 n=1 Tax=Fukomys damarensis TaxID=885580 RepID=A0A091CQK8_FUKDA|nr:Transmembrane protein 65 [Fukomys damarensis]
MRGGRGYGYVDHGSTNTLGRVDASAWNRSRKPSGQCRRPGNLSRGNARRVTTEDPDSQTQNRGRVGRTALLADLTAQGSALGAPEAVTRLAGYVEALASRLGLSIPDLTPKQVDMWQTRVSTHLGKAVGVTIGCILGMFPLIFFGGGEEDEKLEEKN